MLLRLFLPLIALIAFKIISELEEISKDVHGDFVSSYELAVCAREDVYERNLEDAFLYLQQKFPEADATATTADVWGGKQAECSAHSYKVYRESNEDLELSYPNWVYRETVLQPPEG